MFPSLLILLLSVVAADKSGDRDGRIVGGEIANIAEYPYHVIVGVRSSYEKSSNCDGSIIADNWVLTSAHCFADDKLSREVRAQANTAASKGVYFPVDKYFVHEKFVSDTTENDIALVHVVKPFDEKVIIGMWKPGDIIPDESYGVVTGYGCSHEKVTIDDNQFRVVEVPIVNEQVCKNAYSTSNVYIGESTICAGYLGEGQKDACKGDSGGLLVIDGRLAGIVSYGANCGDSNFPGVYTKVSHYYGWINEVMRKYPRRQNNYISNTINNYNRYS